MLALLALHPWACSEPDPAQVASRAYADAMAPLLEDNRELNREFLATAEQIHSGDADPGLLHKRVADRIAPPARELADEVALVQAPEGELQPLHADLVEAWAARAEAYEALLQAYESKDLAAFDKAVSADMTTKAREDRWLHDTNAILAKQGLRFALVP